MQQGGLRGQPSAAALAPGQPPAHTQAHRLPRRPCHTSHPPLCCAQEEFSEELVLPLAVMPGENSPAGQTYVVLARPPGSMALGRFANTLRFRVKEIDPSTGELASGGSFEVAAGHRG